MNFIKTYISAVILLLAIMILFGSLTGCRTVKYMEREKIVYDSTAIKALDFERRVNQYLKNEIERLKSDSLGVRVEFYQDPIYKPSPYLYGRIIDTAIINRLSQVDTTWIDSQLPSAKPWFLLPRDLREHGIIPGYTDKKFILRSDGSIEVNGNIKSVNLTQKAQEEIKKKVETHTDSLAIEKKTEAVSVNTTQESTVKSVTRKWGQILWPLAIAFILGCIITYYRHRIPVLGPILKFFNGRLFNRIPPRP